MSKSACGPHTELVSNNAVIVSRCSCGTLHVTIIAAGITVRMSPELFRALTQSLVKASEKLGGVVTSTGSTSVN